MISHLLNAGLGALVLLLVFAASMGVAAGAVLGDIPAELRALLGAALVQLPGDPADRRRRGRRHRAAAAGGRHALVGAASSSRSCSARMFGAATLQLPAWAQDISPFTHTPKLPAADLTALPVLGLIAIAAALVAAGLASFRRRDLALPT